VLGSVIGRGTAHFCYVLFLYCCSFEKIESVAFHYWGDVEPPVACFKIPQQFWTFEKINVKIINTKKIQGFLWIKKDDLVWYNSHPKVLR